MQGLGRFCALVGFTVLLNACSGVEIVAPPTASPANQDAQASSVAMPDDQLTRPSTEPAITQTTIPPTLVPSPTVPPTTSPLPSPTDRAPDATVATESTPVAVDISTATPPPVTADITGAIVLIRQRYNTINNAVAGYRKTEQDLTGFSTEGGTLQAFYDGDTLRKMVATYFGESGMATEEYYFWDDQIIFVFRSDNTYDRPFGSVVQTAEDRYYFVENTMIRWIAPDKRQIPDADPTFAERERQVQQQKQTLLALLAS